MKGFYIFESETHKEAVDCFELGNIVQSHRLEFAPGTMTEEIKMQALVSKETKTKCSPDDIYDFETGALIALMKMCGDDKVVRACNEAFSEDTFKTYAIKYERELNELKKDFDKVKDLEEYYKKNYNERLEEIKNLKKEKEQIIVAKSILNNKLIEENKKLKSDKDKSWKNYQRNIQKKQDRINELNNIEEKYIKLREEYDKLFEEKEKLQHEYNLCLNSENALKCTVDLLNKSVDKLNKAIYGYKNDLYNTVKRCKELSEENEKLKLDCEKLQQGYNDMIFCGGMRNGKQYTALVELFKKIDQKKVDAAYKEAYNTTLPVWQKEFLKQACNIHKESKEKIELPRTININGTVYRKSIQIKDFGEEITKLAEESSTKPAFKIDRGVMITGWDPEKDFVSQINECLGICKPVSKREKMWDDILELHKTNDVIIEVKKEDVTTFLHEIENRIPEITWGSGVKIFETKYTIKDVYFELKSHDVIYFRLSRATKLTYTSDPHIYPYRELKIIDYLPPMRWDLFKKGRLAVKVNYDNYKEFYEACEKELGKKPSTIYTGEYTVSICKKDGLFEVFTVEHQKNTGKKIVDWESVKPVGTPIYMEDPYDTWKW